MYIQQAIRQGPVNLCPDVRPSSLNPMLTQHSKTTPTFSFPVLLCICQYVFGIMKTDSCFFIWICSYVKQLYWPFSSLTYIATINHIFRHIQSIAFIMTKHIMSMKHEVATFWLIEWSHWLVEFAMIWMYLIFKVTYNLTKITSLL